MVNENLWKQLTNREVEILRLLAEGWSNKQIADKLSITIRTVKFHTNNIYSKMLVASRAEAIAWIWKHLEVELLQMIENLYQSTGSKKSN